MKRKLLVTLLAAAFGVLCAGLAAYVQEEAVSPFYAEATQFTIMSTGEKLPFSINKRFALNSDGDYYEMQTNFDAQRNDSMSQITLMNWETGSHATLFPRAGVKTTVILEDDRVPHAHCTEAILASPSAGKYLGFDVVELVTNAGGVERRALHVPSLNCLRVLRETKRSNEDGVEITSIFRVESVSAGEPNYLLFEVPEDYEEVGPSEAISREIEASQIDFTEEATSTLQERLKRAEERYDAKKW